MKKLYAPCLALLLTVAVASAAGSSQLARAESENFRIVGLDALEIIDQPGQAIVVVAAREAPVNEKLSFSGGYFFPKAQFKRPAAFSFTLYGYSDQPQWAEVKEVVFSFGKSRVSYKARYSQSGADRDTADDRFPDSPFFESMIAQVSPEVAQRIALNGGVRVSTVPATFDVLISASKMSRWKQLVDSVPILERKMLQANTQAKEQVGRTLATQKTGLPLSEEWQESSNARVLQTTMAWSGPSFAVAAHAVVSSQGRRLKPPLVQMFFMGRTASPAWAAVDSVTLSFGGRRLKLGVNDHSIQKMPDGTVLNVISARVPYTDFAALAPGQSLSVEVGGASFHLGRSNMAGLRELLRRSK